MHLSPSSTPPTTYPGHTRQHDYTIAIGHSPWRTKVLALSIDGVEHETDHSNRLSEVGSSSHSSGPAADASAEAVPQRIDARVRGWLTVRVVIRRPTVEGKMVDRDEIHASTAVLGGAREVEVHVGGEIVPLLPEAGSPSEERDLKRTANPTAYALIAGLTTALRLIVSLLGFGALLAFLAEPVKAWAAQYLAPLLDPVFRWLGRLLEPLGHALTTIGRLFGRIIDFLFGWLPHFQLPFDIPDWLWTVVKVALLAFLTFSVSRANLKRRKKHLEQTDSGSSVQRDYRR